MKQNERVMTARLLAGLTNADLAAVLGIAEVNVIRWQGSYPLPARQIAPLASATGLPDRWLRSGGELEGLIIARPLRIDARSPKNVLRANAEKLARLLPLLCPGADIAAICAPVGTAYIFAKERYCLIVMTLFEYGLDLSSQQCRKIDIDDGTWMAAFQNDQQALSALLSKAELGVWKECLLNESVRKPALAISNIEVRVLDSSAEQMIVAEVLRFVQELRRRGGCEVTYAINTGDNDVDRK